jgi:fructoselysine-6-phosphate deglycase
MLNFDEDRFLRIQCGAVGLAGDIDRAVTRELDGGAKNVVFLGAGGAGILMYPAFDLLQQRSTFPAYLAPPGQVILTGLPVLGPDSLVIMPSLSGTSPDSVAALDYCKKQGARVFTFTGHADSTLAQQADMTFTNFAEDDTSCESFYLQSLLVVLSVLKHEGVIDDYDELVGQLTRLPALLLEVKRSFEPDAEKLAVRFKDEPYHIMAGAGSTWAQAWYYGMCILEEMQWIRTRPIHGSDFFHGTLELVEEGVSTMVLHGEDAARPLTERVERFVKERTDKATVFDAATYDLPGISAEVRSLISPVLLATVLERLSAHLEVLRDHPLTTRRYYRRVAY